MPAASFRVEAEFVAAKDGKVFLEKKDGSVITVPIDRLSEDDQKFLTSLTEKKEKTVQADSARPPTGDDAGTHPMVDSSDGQVLARKARSVFEANCYRCHGQDGATEGGFNFVLNLEKLVKTSVKPRDASGSLLYERISSHDNDMVMPPAGEKPRPSADDIAAVRQWIQAGAPTLPEDKPRE